MAKITAKSIQAFFSTPHRWCKKMAKDGHGRYCLYGALEKIYGCPNIEKEAAERLRTAILNLTGVYMEIAAFNDAPTTTFADIQRVVRKAGV